MQTEKTGKIAEILDGLHYDSQTYPWREILPDLEKGRSVRALAEDQDGRVPQLLALAQVFQASAQGKRIFFPRALTQGYTVVLSPKFSPLVAESLREMTWRHLSRSFWNESGPVFNADKILVAPDARGKESATALWSFARSVGADLVISPNNEEGQALGRKAVVNAGKIFANPDPEYLSVQMDSVARLPFVVTLPEVTLNQIADRDLRGMMRPGITRDRALGQYTAALIGGQMDNLIQARELGTSFFYTLRRGKDMEGNLDLCVEKGPSIPQLYAMHRPDRRPTQKIMKRQGQLEKWLEIALTEARESEEVIRQHNRRDIFAQAAGAATPFFMDPHHAWLAGFEDNMRTEAATRRAAPQKGTGMPNEIACDWI